MKTPGKNTIALIATGLITVGFFISGLVDILDYFIVKALLLLALGTFAFYIFMVVLRLSEKNKEMP